MPGKWRFPFREGQCPNHPVLRCYSSLFADSLHFSSEIFAFHVTFHLEFNQNFISCIAANTYGQNDHFDENRSHVISSLIRKLHDAKQNNLPAITIWGTGTALREFIYVDDLAYALHLLMQKYSDPEIINIGSGYEISIQELSTIIQKVIQYKGTIRFDSSKPDGMKRRLLDNTKMKALGFTLKISLEEGISRTYQFMLKAQ